MMCKLEPMKPPVSRCVARYEHLQLSDSLVEHDTGNHSSAPSNKSTAQEQDSHEGLLMLHGPVSRGNVFG